MDTPTHDSAGSRRDSISSTYHDSSTLSLESSFRLESGHPGQAPDSEKHPKGKRKRTTAQDKSILESAYNANPKPDKAARLDIVKRVSLNEKEVQIWFQNRRQNDRRKSRPLSPQEIAALRYGGGVQSLSEPIPFNMSNAAVRALEARSFDGPGSERGPPTPEEAHSQHSSQCSPRAMTSSTFPNPVTAHPAEEPRRFEAESDSHMFSQSFPSSIGYLSNRWHSGHSFSTPSNAERPVEDPTKNESTANSSPASILPPPSRALSRSSSQVRLSLSMEGKAELVSAQPSPPRPVQNRSPVEAETLPPVRRDRSLQRSKSALPGITLPPISTLTAHLPPQLARGRSRDPHAWESCCQADFRDDLTKLAENESSGSAVAAISLLRSSSSSASLNSLVHSHSADEGSPSAMSGNGSILRSNSNKRNAHAAKNAARSDSAKKPRLGRAQSSIGRLQSLSAENDDQVERVLEPENKKPAGKASLSTILSPSGGDSDKENWSPDEDGNPARRRTNPPSAAGTPKKTGSPVLAAAKTNFRRTGRILGEQNANSKRSSLLLGSRANTAPNGISQRRSGKALLNDAPSLSIFEDGETRGEGPMGGDNKENHGEQQRKEPGGTRKREVDVDRFMRGADVSPSKRPDMDCIAGLLSLSQGNWR